MAPSLSRSQRYILTHRLGSPGLPLVTRYAGKLRVVAFSGSARDASCNGGLVRYAASAAPRVAPGLDITVLDVSRWPLFNSDLISIIGKRV